MHPYVATALACALVLFNPVPSQADDLPLKKLKVEAVDWLSFGVASLEADLRLRELELCAKANCRSQEVEISVFYLAAKPDWASLPWPPDGAIVIRVETKRTGSDSSMTTESGCRSSLNRRALGQDTRAPWMNYARFFIPREKWIELTRESKDSATMERMVEISRRIVLVATERHEWSLPSGLPDRAVWITCAARLIDLLSESFDKIAIVSKGQWPK